MLVFTSNSRSHFLAAVLFTSTMLFVHSSKLLIPYDSSPVGFIQLCFLPSVIGYTELQEGEGLSVSTDMSTIVKTMAAPDSGLDIRDRMWLKITIPNAFIGKVVTALAQLSNWKFQFHKHGPWSLFVVYVHLIYTLLITVVCFVQDLMQQTGFIHMQKVFKTDERQENMPVIF